MNFIWHKGMSYSAAGIHDSWSSRDVCEPGLCHLLAPLAYSHVPCVSHLLPWLQLHPQMLYITGVYTVGPDIASALQV